MSNTPKKACVIITGISSGLGEALAKCFLEAGHNVTGLGRRYASTLDPYKIDGRLNFIQYDLSTLNDEQAAHCFAHLPQDSERYILINNAGTVAPIVNAQHIDATALDYALKVNVAAPILLCSAFLKATHSPGSARQVLNISSGAGRKSMPGWAVYCATKAALDRYTETLAAEWTNTDTQCVSLAPGVIDSPMQAHIRQAERAHFPALDQFIALKENQALSTAHDIAQAIYNYLNRDDFGQTVLDDIRNYL